jgi:undecaprenyl-diphosphatase
MGWSGFVLLLAFLTICVSVWIFIAVAEEVMEGEHQGVEEQFLTSLRTPGDLHDPLGPEWLEVAALDLTSLGSGTVLVLVTLLVIGFLVLQRKFAYALFVLLATSLGSGLGHVMKQFFDRPRPSVVPHLAEVLNTSFPSGHSLSSSLVWLTLGALLAQAVDRRREKIYIIATALFIGFLVGLTRVYLGVHYPSDVVAGWCVGTAWALICWMAAYWLQQRRKIRA